MTQEAPEARDYYEGLQGAKAAEDLFSTTDMSKLIKTYMEETIPEEIRNTKLFKDFWGVLGNTLKLTFLSEKEIPEFESLFREAKYNYIMSVPVYDYTAEEMKIMQQIKIYFAAAIRRSVGSRQHVINERTMQATTISQNIRSNTERFSQSSGGGMMGKIRRMF